MGFFDRSSRQPTKRQFARTVMKTLRQIGDRRDAAFDEPEFRLMFTKAGASAGIINLGNLYAEYCNHGKGERDLLLRRACIGFVKRFETPDDFDDAKHDLLPALRLKATEEQTRLDFEIRGEKWRPLVSLPLSEHLDVCLVYDLPDRMQFINQENLDTWGVSLFEAAEVAKQNLAERQFAVGARDDKLFFVVAGDAYDSARMVLLDHVRALPLSGTPIAMPANRDSLMFTSAEDTDGLEMMAEMAEEIDREPRPLCSIPHMLVGDEWVPWLPPADHPHHERFRLLSLKRHYRDYEEQKKLLDKLHEKTGEDIFVASFTVVERDGKHLSYCVWSNTVLSWLPKTDLIALYDDETKLHELVPWERAQKVVGHLIRPLDRYPPRWLVEEFPTPEQIEQMRAGELAG